MPHALWLHNLASGRNQFRVPACPAGVAIVTSGAFDAGLAVQLATIVAAPEPVWPGRLV